MIAAGLLVHLNSDDPTMFRTDIGKEYVDFVGQNDYPPDVAKQLVRNGVDADLARRRRQGGAAAAFDAEIARARQAELAATVIGDARCSANTDPALRRGWHAVARERRRRPRSGAGAAARRDWVLVRLAGDGRRRAHDRWPRSPTGARTASRRSRRAGSTATTLRCGYHGWCFDGRRRVHRDPGARRAATASRRAPSRPTPAALAERHGMVFLAPEAPRDRAARRARAPTTRRSSHGAARARPGPGSAPGSCSTTSSTWRTSRSCTRRRSARRGGRRVEIDGRARRVRHDRAQHALRSRTTRTRASRQGIRPLLQQRSLAYALPGAVLGRACASTTSRRAAPTCSTSTCSRRTTTTAASTRRVHRNDLDGDRTGSPKPSRTSSKILDEDLAAPGALRRPPAAARPHRRGARARPTAMTSSCAASSPTSSTSADRRRRRATDERSTDADRSRRPRAPRTGRSPPPRARSRSTCC